MRRVRHSKSGLFLIELMICILFFSFTAGICIRFFAKSHNMSRDAKNLYQAQQEASSMAEILEKDIDSLDNISVYYDEDWKQCNKEDMVYWLEVTEQESDQTKQQKGESTKDSENTGSSEQKESSENTENSEEKVSTEGTSSEQTNLKRIKIAVYSGTESKKSEIYHLNLSIYVPQDGETQKDSIRTGQDNVKQKGSIQTEQDNVKQKGSIQTEQDGVRQKGSIQIKQSTAIQKEGAAL